MYLVTVAYFQIIRLAYRIFILPTYVFIFEPS